MKKERAGQRLIDAATVGTGMTGLQGLAFITKRSRLWKLHDRQGEEYWKEGREASYWSGG